MAIPSDPTVTQIVTEGLKRGGRVAPTSTQISDATTHQFREVKADITMQGGRVDVLLSQYVSPFTTGVSRIAWPTDASEIRSVVLIDTWADGYYTALAQAGGASTITLSASLSAAALDLIGRTVFLLSGTGAGQYKQITAFDTGTKVATVDSAWTTNPTSGTTYLIETRRQKLWERDKPQWFDTLEAPWTAGNPLHSVMVGREMWVDYAPDRAYGLFWDYWAHLDRIDESGTAFTRHLREYRSLWVQGVAVKVMQRFDEDRYGLELGVYQTMLAAYGGQEADIGQVIWRDV